MMPAAIATSRLTIISAEHLSAQSTRNSKAFSTSATREEAESSSREQPVKSGAKPPHIVILLDIESIALEYRYAQSGERDAEHRPYERAGPLEQSRREELPARKGGDKENDECEERPFPLCLSLLRYAPEQHS
jgi:hypothetical protein